MSTKEDRPANWSTVEDLLGEFITHVKQVGCAFCGNVLHGGGKKIVLENKSPSDGVQDDGKGHAVTFLCHDCANADRDPKHVPRLLPDGKGVATVNVDQLKDINPVKDVKQIMIEETATRVADEIKLHHEPKTWEQLEASISDRVDKDKLKAFAKKINAESIPSVYEDQSGALTDEESEDLTSEESDKTE